MHARKELDNEKAALEAKLTEAEARTAKKTSEVVNLNLRVLQMRKQLDDSKAASRKADEDAKAKLKTKETELTETKDNVSNLQK